MKKQTLHIVLAGCAVLSLLALPACTETWDGHYLPDSGITPTETLWDRIEAEPTLSDFKAILEQTPVYANNKVTGVTYATLLDAYQTITLWAPINGSFNKDSLLTLLSTPEGTALVEKNVVKNHLSRYAVSLTSTTNREIMLLNQKVMRLTATAFGSTHVTRANILASNGVLHLVNGTASYYPSIYEGLLSDYEISQLGAFLKAYQKDSLDEKASVASGIEDGKTIYVDSVTIPKNALLSEFGYLNNEDSAYWMIAPTDAAWEAAYQKILPYFNFAYTENADTLQRLWTQKALMRDLVFNVRSQASATDSLLSTAYRSSQPGRHVYQKPFEPGGILADVKERIDCSNGVIYKVDRWPFTLQQAFFQPIKVEAEQDATILKSANCTFNFRSVASGNLSNNAYLDMVPLQASSNPSITFQIKNTLAGKYDVCVVCAPQTVYKTPLTHEDSLDVFRPYKFRSTLSYMDKKGISKNYTSGGKTFTNNPYALDTVCVAEAFEFPTCSYNREDVTVTLTIQVYVLSRENDTYNREMFIDCIYLRPRED